MHACCPDPAGWDSLLAERPTLATWLENYAGIRRDYVESVDSLGVDLAPEGYLSAETLAVRERVLAKGAHERNAGASLWAGELSPACAACADGLGSRTFAPSLRCNRSCYFCFNRNQESVSDRLPAWDDAQRELKAFSAEVGGDVTHVGLTGGEPLLYKEETYTFLRRARAEYPGAHLRLYTAGDFLDAECLAELRDAGLDELRLSVKIDVDDGAGYPTSVAVLIEQACNRLELALRYIPAVMVEMPVIPGTGEAMQRLLRRLDEIGVFGINLLEFGYPVSDWAPFRQRGFEIKNPPYEVPYDYSYPAGLPVEGSELLCLELLEFALDEGLSLGVHYCSLENKNRGQVFRQNAAVNLAGGVYELDRGDFFYKTAKVFDDDVEAVRELLAERGICCEIDGDDGSLSFPPSRLDLLMGLPVVPAISTNVIETTARGSALREVALDAVWI
ncbi:MAG: radical SAM protein [Coriobacteriia bacterium]|nr:radical SAM protein [Coriobacteriia bacterium]MBS5477910.1 radical SAM protein [Coriobacteriia bacterium]